MSHLVLGCCYRKTEKWHKKGRSYCHMPQLFETPSPPLIQTVILDSFEHVQVKFLCQMTDKWPWHLKLNVVHSIQKCYGTTMSWAVCASLVKTLPINYHPFVMSLIVCKQVSWLLFSCIHCKLIFVVLFFVPGINQKPMWTVYDCTKHFK